MKILITGGHLTPALSFIDYIKEKQSQDRLVFVGREYSQDVLKQRAVERYEINKRRVKFIPFEAERLGGDLKALLAKLPNFIVSVREAGKILKKEKPAIFLSFGGYVAVPFALAAWLQKIPVVTHEQTLVIGMANRFIGVFSKKIAISFKEINSQFSEERMIFTGNPLRKGVFLKKHSKPAWLKIENQEKNTNPILLIMGGNQGAQIINEYVRDNLKSLTSSWIVIHLCGKPTARMNTKEILEREKSHLPEELRENYYVQEWVDGRDLFWLYRNAFGAVSRSGANSTQELAAVGLPSILIPLPQSHKNEQRLNAEWLVNAGGAIILDQRSLNHDHANLALDKLVKLNKQMRAALQELDLPKNAAAKIYKVIQDVVAEVSTTKSK